VGLYWQRYGRVEPGMEVSGLDEELQLALSGGLPRLLCVIPEGAGTVNASDGDRLDGVPFPS
jgi:hypothetical protein